MTLVLSSLYLKYEWVFWPLVMFKLLSDLGRYVYAGIVWFPRIILDLIMQRPSIIVELVAMLSAILFAVWTKNATEVGLSWKAISTVLGVSHLGVLISGSWRGRVKVMIVSTVFWSCLMFAYLPKRFVLAHVFLIPLCWAYAVTTLALLRHCGDRRN